MEAACALQAPRPAAGASDARGAPAAPAAGLDRRIVGRPRGTGVETYARSLAQAVRGAGWREAPLADAASSDDPVPGRAERWAAAFSPLPAAARTAGGGLLARDAFRRAQVHFDVYGRFMRLRAASPPALMHWSSPLPLRLLGAPNLCTVHDLIPLLRPDLTPMPAARTARLLRRLRRECAHVVTVSEASRREIVAALGWPADRVTSLGQAVEPSPGADGAGEAFGLSREDYFLHVGTVERRKNVGRLIEAYRLSGSGRALVLAGPDGFRAAEELAPAAGLLVEAGAQAREAAGRPRVVRLGWVERPALLGLIRESAGVLAPSLAEGFGLPAAEAMALGAPAVTTGSGAPAEVAGGAALLVDPLDVRALASAIAALDADAGLRRRLSAAGLVRARAFSASGFAARLAELYAAVLRQAAADAG